MMAAAETAGECDRKGTVESHRMSLFKCCDMNLWLDHDNASTFFKACLGKYYEARYGIEIRVRGKLRDGWATIGEYSNTSLLFANHWDQQLDRLEKLHFAVVARVCRNTSAHQMLIQDYFFVMISLLDVCVTMQTGHVHTTQFLVDCPKVEFIPLSENNTRKMTSNYRGSGCLGIIPVGFDEFNIHRANFRKKIVQIANFVNVSYHDVFITDNYIHRYYCC